MKSNFIHALAWWIAIAVLVLVAMAKYFSPKPVLVVPPTAFRHGPELRYVIRASLRAPFGESNPFEVRLAKK